MTFDSLVSISHLFQELNDIKPSLCEECKKSRVENLREKFNIGKIDACIKWIQDPIFDSNLVDHVDKIINFIKFIRLKDEHKIDEIRNNFINFIYEHENYTYDGKYAGIYAYYTLTKNTCINNRICFNYDDAIINGHLNCLSYMHKNGPELGNNLCYLAAKHGRLDCLKYVHTNGCDIKYIDQDTNHNVCDCAANYGYLDCLTYAHKNGAEFKSSVCTLAAAAGYLNCVKYACEYDRTLIDSVCEISVKHNRLDCLIYANEHGCKILNDLNIIAIVNDSFDCLKYINEKIHSMQPDICLFIAYKGRLNCLKYAHKKGYNLNVIYDNLNTCEHAASRGHLDCLIYANEHGCPLDSGGDEAGIKVNSAWYAFIKEQFECFEYANTHGCIMKEHAIMVIPKKTFDKYKEYLAKHNKN
jgi:hypothetical protein